MCTKCREVKNEWFVAIRDGKSFAKDLKKKFDIMYGKGQFDIATKDTNWTGKCRKCGTAYIIQK